MDKRKRPGRLLAAAALALAVAAAGPGIAGAAQGLWGQIVGTGLVYDDVYGVFGTTAVAKKVTDKTATAPDGTEVPVVEKDLVDSSGKVLVDSYYATYTNEYGGDTLIKEASSPIQFNGLSKDGKFVRASRPSDNASGLIQTATGDYIIPLDNWYSIDVNDASSFWRLPLPGMRGLAEKIRAHTCTI